MRISDWSSDVCSSDLARKDANALFVFDRERRLQAWRRADEPTFQRPDGYRAMLRIDRDVASGIACRARSTALKRSEEQTAELQSLMRNSYAVFCLKKQKLNI